MPDVPRCPLCQRAQSIVHLDKLNPHRDTNDTEQLYQIRRCGNCSLLYTWPRPKNDAQIDVLYENYYGTPNGAPPTQHRMSMAKRTIRKYWHAFCGQYLARMLTHATGTVLDIGCGTGDILAELTARGLVAEGIEVNAEAVQTCRRRGLSVRGGQFDTIDFGTARYDTIVMWHTIEHFPDPVETLKKVRNLMKPAATVFLYCPNGESHLARWFGTDWFPWQIPYHISHFGPKTFETCAHRAGLRIQRLAAVTPEYYVHHSIQRAVNSKPTWPLRALTIGRFHRSRLFRLAVCITFRILDIVFPGQGECLQVELVRDDRTL